MVSCGGKGGAEGRVVPPSVIQPPLPVETRSFHMALTPFSGDLTANADEFSKDYVVSHGDMLAFHFDNLPIGLPWEALAAGNVTTELEDYFQPFVALAASVPVGTRLYVAISPLDQGRVTIAPGSGGASFPASLGAAEFDNPNVEAGYLRFCQFIVETFDPDYLAILVEGNIYQLQGDAQFQNLNDLYNTVYDVLKADKPELQILSTFQVEFMHGLDQFNLLAGFADRLDLIGLSMYPSLGGGFEPAEIPANWVSRFADEVSSPIIVSETGYGSEPFVNVPLNIDAPGSESLQQAYLNWLFEEAMEQNVRLVVWFFPTDLSGTLAVLAPEFSTLGLTRADLTSKPAEAVWDSKLAVLYER
jgi:hypothetical protein